MPSHTAELQLCQLRAAHHHADESTTGGLVEFETYDEMILQKRAKQASFLYCELKNMMQTVGYSA
jgi:hypothetical protein